MTERDPLWVGGAVALVLVVAFVLSLTHSIPFVGGGGRVLHAEFSTARQVTSKTPVRVHGIPVGNVESTRYDAARRLTEVTFRLTDDAVRLHGDATAALRWRTVLGGRMELALDPGSSSAPALAGDRISIRHTRIQTELEDVTRVLAGDGTTGARALLRELPRGLGGPAAGRAIDEAGSGLRPFAPAMRALRGQQEHDLGGLVSSTARTLHAMAGARAALGSFVGGAQRTLRVTANDRAQLAATFRGAPGALSATVGVTRSIDATLPSLNRLVADIRPGARVLGPALARTRPTLDRLNGVLRDARPLVVDLRPAVDRLADASGVGTRLLAALDPTVRRLADDLVPYLEHTDGDLHLPVYQLIGPTISTLDAASGQYSDVGHIINFPIQPAENSLSVIPCATFVTDPTAAQKVRCGAINRALRSLLGASTTKARHG